MFLQENLHSYQRLYTQCNHTMIVKTNTTLMPGFPVNIDYLPVGYYSVHLTHTTSSNTDAHCIFWTIIYCCEVSL